MDDLFDELWIVNPEITTSSAWKSPKGRKAKPAQLLSDPKARAVTFSKRKTGLLTKACQLTHMTGADVIVLIQPRSHSAPHQPKPRPVGGASASSSSQPAPTPRPKGRNNYSYVCPKWRGMLVKPAIEEIMGLDSNAAESSSSSDHLPEKSTARVPYATDAEGCKIVKRILLKDKLSDATDSFCVLTFALPGQKREKVDNSWKTSVAVLEPDDEVPWSGFLSPPDSPTDDDHHDDDHHRPKKRRACGPVEIKFINDKKKRGICFCKRKTGLMKKAFELVAMTDCNLFMMLAYPEEEGGADLYHAYASPAWRSMALSKGVMSELRGLQMASRAIPSERVAEVMNRCASSSSSQLPRPSLPEYVLPLVASMSRINKTSVEGLVNVKDEFLSFVWRDVSKLAVSLQQRSSSSSSRHGSGSKKEKKVPPSACEDHQTEPLPPCFYHLAGGGGGGDDLPGVRSEEDGLNPDQGPFVRYTTATMDYWYCCSVPMMMPLDDCDDDTAAKSEEPDARLDPCVTADNNGDYATMDECRPRKVFRLQLQPSDDVCEMVIM